MEKAEFCKMLNIIEPFYNSRFNRYNDDYLIWKIFSEYFLGYDLY